MQLLFQLLLSLAEREGGGAKLARGEIRIGKAKSIPCPSDRDEIIIRVPRQVAFIEHGAGGDHLHHLAAHQALARLGRLLADGDLLPRGEQTGDIGGRGVVRDAAHGSPRPLRQGEVEQGGRFARIALEHLVEVPESKKEDGVGKLLLDAGILRHHGGCFEHAREL